jgi:hypothetical protein
VRLRLRWTIILLIALGPVPGIPGLDQFVDALWPRSGPHLAQAGARTSPLGLANPVLQAPAVVGEQPDSPPPYSTYLTTDPAAMPAASSPTRTIWSPTVHRRAHSDAQKLWAGDLPGLPGPQLALLAVAIALCASQVLLIGLQRATPLRAPPPGAAPHSA